MAKHQRTVKLGIQIPRHVRYSVRVAAADVYVFRNWRVMCILQFKLESGLFARTAQTEMTERLVFSVQKRRVCICQVKDVNGKYGPTDHVNHFTTNPTDMAEFYENETQLGALPRTVNDEADSVADRLKDQKRRCSGP